MKAGFVTCVKLGLSCIEKIYAIGGKLDVLVTLHDEKSKKKSGRIFLDEFSHKNLIPLYKISHINDGELLSLINRYQLDWLFIIGWSQIASPEIISAPKKGVIGAHPTLLPEGRGRAAIPWAILKGLNKTGVTFFKMDQNVDSGPILAQIEIPMDIKENATTLYNKINCAHEDIIAKLYYLLEKNKINPLAQDESKATYWEGRKPEDGELHFEMTVDDVDKTVRATTHPYPGAYIIRNKIKIIIWNGIKGSINGGIPLDFKDGIYTAIEYSQSDINE